jgi:hypothetical protein
MEETAFRTDLDFAMTVLNIVAYDHSLRSAIWYYNTYEPSYLECLKYQCPFICSSRKQLGLLVLSATNTYIWM